MKSSISSAKKNGACWSGDHVRHRVEFNGIPWKGCSAACETWSLDPLLFTTSRSRVALCEELPFSKTYIGKGESSVT